MVDIYSGAAPAHSAAPASVQRRSPLRWYLGGAVLLLVAGAGLGGWAMTEYRGWHPAAAVPAPLKGDSAVAPAPATPPPMPGDAVPAPTPSPDAIAERVALLEARVAQLNVAAESMNGNAARAEALLIAFAARRALDRGLALGTLESQLRLRFGNAQPNAVRTVIEAARMPVTLDRLQTEFDRLTPELIGARGANAGVWAGMQRGFSELFVVRRADAPSTRADQRLARAQHLLDAGLVDAAARETAALPGASAATAWLAEAARYHEARRALDLIETAAILAPREETATVAAALVPQASPTGRP
jgi:hypothetical protein